MNAIFAKYLEAGIFGSVIILLILLLRLCLRRAPRRILCLLWILAAVRLMLPFRLESRLSLQPDLDHVAVVIEQTQETPVVEPAVPEVPASHPADDTAQHTQLQPITDTPVQQAKVPVDIMTVLAFVWGSVACAAVIYMLVSYAMLKLRVRDAVRVADGIMQSDKISGAFLLGYFRPKIYLPFHVNSTDRKFIVAHEQAHIARGDNWWKLLVFLCASVHWYNPLVWLAYVLLCRDIELACDERVIRDLNIDDRKGYSMALLNCGKRLAGVSVCPVAFGEVSLKTRIKSILRYRKPGVWITVIAFVLIAATAVCFLTSPVAKALPVEKLEDVTETQETEQTTEVTEPETTQTTIQETKPETVPETTAAHIHAYTVKTVAPTCAAGGYDLHTCACGDQYTDKPVGATDHQYYWAEADYAENKMLVKCATCTSAYWEKIPLNYDDTGSTTQRLESYATAYGFQISSEANLSGAKCFSYSADSSEIDGVNSERFVAAGKRIVDQVYDYCVDNNLKVSEQICYIDVHYTGTGYGLPSTQLTGALQTPSYPSVQWDLSSNFYPNSILGGYTGSSGNSGSSVKILNYYINVYIAPIHKETPKENNLDINVEDAVESTEPVTPTVTEPLIEETVPETTGQTDAAWPEEECITDIQVSEETTVPEQSEDAILE